MNGQLQEHLVALLLQIHFELVHLVLPVLVPYHYRNRTPHLRKAAARILRRGEWLQALAR